MPEKHEVYHIEVRTRDLDRASGYYGKVFGWEIEPIPGAQYGVARTGGAQYGGFLQPPNNAIPLGVTSYILVDDCAKMSEKVQALGGFPLFDKMEVPGGAFVQFIDPLGHDFGLWEQSVPDEAVEVRDPALGFQWIDLRGPDAAAVAGFYGELFGWSFEEDPARPGCLVRKVEGGVSVGIAGGRTDMPMPAVTTFVGVSDAGGFAESVKAEGGSVEPLAFAAPMGLGAQIAIDPEGNRLAFLIP